MSGFDLAKGVVPVWKASFLVLQDGFLLKIFLWELVQSEPLDMLLNVETDIRL